MLTAPTQRAPEIVYLDVGQGDSVLIRLPGRTEILVDGGGSPFSDFDVGKNTVVPALRALGVDELEVMIATHADTDHIEGLPSVLAEIPTQQLIIGADASGDPLYDRLLRAARYRGVDVQQVRRGESMRLGRARLEFLHPSVQPENPENDDNADNDNSVVFVLHYDGRARALFLGDASVDIEKQLAFADVDIVMAGHHGSSHSTSAALLQATSPDIAVISYGRNTYGHPHPSVLRRLEAVNANIFETYQHGAVRASLTEDYVIPTVTP
jgi:competence protein ComEC